MIWISKRNVAVIKSATESSNSSLKHLYLEKAEL